MNARLRVLPERAECEVTVDGYAVPLLSVREIAETGQWNVIYDRRHCVLAESVDELARWIPFLANVAAIANGYSCHGENSVWQPNPHQVRVMEIESRDTPGD